MGFGKILFGCVLCVGSLSAASAMDADSQDLGSMQRTVDSNSNHEGAGSSSGGDALGLPRETTTAPSSSSSSSGDNCPQNTPARGARGRQNRVGWQSLLPGSIQ
ncbi:hypothetical protein [Dyella terrae]|uniref:hypothetical protein n=1 Tax=Dyella terrae TaxID=522259 RepID=UPI001EFD2077|nr:hypothetical protein [Dyella terrae]ULU25268.1 hypothetical protein DYST_02193 [Dyella terrae]